MDRYECFMEDYGTGFVDFKPGLKSWKDSVNTCLISEDSLARTLKLMAEKSFAVLTAYRKGFTKKENIERNRKLRAELDKNKLGVHSLVGHWQEAPNGKDWQSAPKSELVDAVERSYCVIKPDGMLDKDFFDIIAPLATIDRKTQDAIVFRLVDVNPGVQLYSPATDSFKKLADGGGSIGTKAVFGKIGQAYSQHVKKPGVSFRFEGKEVPSGNFGSLAAKRAGYCWS